MKDEIKVTYKEATGTAEVKVQPGAANEDFTYLPLEKMLGLDDAKPQERQQVKEVWDHFKSDTTADKLYQIRSLENKLGVPRLGESRLGKIYNYVKMTQQIKELEDQRNAL
jgi:hypothetical protein